jgi:hypothetical protein
MKPEKGPAAMHLQRPSLLSKEWGEVQSAQAIGKGISFLAVTEVPSSLKWNYEMLK